MTFRTINKDYPLILASASPRRRRFLEQIGLPFLSLTSLVEENLSLNDPSVNTTSPLKNPSDLARYLAEKKARAVLTRSEKSWILGADTLVVLEKRILGKPRDQEEAHSTLSLLSGKEHQVITGFCLLDPAGTLAHSQEVITLVKMKKMTGEEIKAYVNSGEPFGKAGSYAIQGVGAFMVESISGSYTNVVGLPVCALVKALLKVGAIKNFPPLS